MSAKELITAKVGKWIQENPGKAKEINATVVVELTGDGGGRWLLDTTAEPASLTESADAQAETTISTGADTMEKILTGELGAQAAFLTGQVQVDGNLGIAIKLGEIFE